MTLLFLLWMMVLGLAWWMLVRRDFNPSRTRRRGAGQ